MRKASLFLILLLGFSTPFVVAQKWQPLPNAPENNGKQDDLYFVTADLGWSVNGSGEIWKTRDGGITWRLQIKQPGTFFRCIGFIDSLHGFAGNIAPGFFDGVSDTNPLYETMDGGETWTPVFNFDRRPPTGLCAIQILNDSVIFATGRVSGPAWMMRSIDAGQSWQSINLPPEAQMGMDVFFFDLNNGFLCSAIGGPRVEEASALVLRTQDGGQSWQTVYRSPRVGDITWKMSFPSANVGYISLLSYSAAPQRWVLKTTDSGGTWQEMKLKKNGAIAFGIGFIDEKRGWIGTDRQAYYTKNGGKRWKKAKIGIYTNKFRFVRTEGKVIGYAIGRNVFKLE